MCSKNRIGPKTVPCGTPESTVTRSDCIPSTTTRCSRKLEIHSHILLNVVCCNIVKANHLQPVQGASINKTSLNILHLMVLFMFTDFS